MCPSCLCRVGLGDIAGLTSDESLVSSDLEKEKGEGDVSNFQRFPLEKETGICASRCPPRSHCGSSTGPRDDARPRSMRLKLNLVRKHSGRQCGGLGSRFRSRICSRIRRCWRMPGQSALRK